MSVLWRFTTPNRLISQRFECERIGEIWRLSLKGCDGVLHESMSLRSCKNFANQYENDREEWRGGDEHS